MSRLAAFLAGLAVAFAAPLAAKAGDIVCAREVPQKPVCTLEGCFKGKQTLECFNA